MKKTGVLVFLILFLALAAQADDGTQDEYSSDANDTLPVYDATNDIALQNHNALLDATVNFHFSKATQENVYDKEGNLIGVQVIDEEGNVLFFGKGVFDRTENGNSVYALETGTGTQYVTLGQGEGESESEKYFITYTPRGGMDDGEKPNPVIIFAISEGYAGEDPLKKAASDPSYLPDLMESIRNGLNEAGGAGQDAYEQYLENSSTYYEKAYQTIFSNLKKLKEGGIVTGDGFEKIKNTGALSREARDVIDGIVEAIELEAQPGEIPYGSVDEIAEQLYVYKAEYLLPAIEIYDSRIEESLKYIQDVIDGVIASRVALYFNIEKEKIDVLINLPKLDIKKKSE